MQASEAQSSPLVTVLMPVCDGEQFLREAIDSILAQTFTNFEFLILDDASMDSSRSIVLSYDDPRICLLANDRNLGVTRTLNRGIQQARGRYVARMDADDLSMPERLERQVAHLDANPDCAIVATFARIIDTHSVPQGEICIDLSPQELDWQLQFGNRLIHGAVMMRADVVRRLGAYDEAMKCSQDYDLWLRISDEHEIHTLPEFLYSWRQHGRGISSLYADEQERYATQARVSARRRRIDRILTGVSEGKLSPTEGARILLKRMRDEDEYRAVLRERRDLISRLRVRIKIFDTVCYWFSEYRRLREVREIIRSCAASACYVDSAGKRMEVLITGSAQPG
ncbi:MAG: glycosyltransferase [Deltaproteobacteria bacterium]|jgi:glycosyltransferase involved in cell wall biosynthesis|nr:glycosyltransferase [Deltaproteobacteria bacterium]